MKNKSFSVFNLGRFGGTIVKEFYEINISLFGKEGV
jgi:hypothetical protein